MSSPSTTIITKRMETKNTQQSSEKSENNLKSKNTPKATKTSQSQSYTNRKKTEKQVSTTLKSLTTTDAVKRCCERVGIQPLEAEVALQLGEDVEHRVRELIELAKQYMLHSNRTKLMVADITSARAHSNAELDTIPLSVSFLESTQDVDVDLEAVVEKDERLSTTKDGGIACTWLVLEGSIMDSKKNRGMQVSTTLTSKSGKQKDNLNAFISAIFSEDIETREFTLSQLATSGWVCSMLVELVHTVCDVIRKDNAGKYRLLALEAVKSISLNKHIFIDAHLLMLTATLKSVIFIEKPSHYKPARELLQRNALVILIRLLNEHASPYNGLEGQLERETSRLINSSKTHPVNLYAALLVASNSSTDMIEQCVMPKVNVIFSNCMRALTEKHTHLSLYLPLLIVYKLSDTVALYISLKKTNISQTYLDHLEMFGEMFLFQCISFGLREPYTRQVAKKKSTQVFTGVGKMDEKDLEKLMYLTNLPTPEETSETPKNFPHPTPDIKLTRYHFREGEKIQFRIHNRKNQVIGKVDWENVRENKAVVKNLKTRSISQSQLCISNDLRIVF